MSIATVFLAELERESVSTEQILLRVPADKLDWRPHEKSMTLGELAWHIAGIPARIAAVVEAGTFDVGGARPGVPTSADFVARLHSSIAEARRVVGALDDDAIKQPMNFMRGDEVALTLPKLAVIRGIMLNHSYHHRGQLTVYLRLLDVPLPAIYGTSADEKAF
jgi:uncharacterized damage-inducible protein DinB